jgi:hypothetical protein
MPTGMTSMLKKSLQCRFGSLFIHVSLLGKTFMTFKVLEIASLNRSTVEISMWHVSAILLLEVLIMPAI